MNFVYDTSKQKLLKIAKNDYFWKTEVGGQTVLPDRSLLKVQKIGRKYRKIKCDIFGYF